MKKLTKALSLAMCAVSLVSSVPVSAARTETVYSPMKHTSGGYILYMYKDGTSSELGRMDLEKKWKNGL